ncbi:hypothetical protein [Clostridium beijerinckii]|uniref:Uncharacterized protein n=1 Tax=Clostridium beijerinckii TaxID=1520 RepID=A0A1S8RPI9_CLOBE|nr:hypothetical protein [Clostridium beijerinckii]NRY60121.1 hypothetical protein [Clostridium beijerinckii]OOM55019.1 hypothetical protein CLBCK_45720 [Clostridium beijerinckii]
MIWFYKKVNKGNTRISTIVCNTGMFYFRNIIAIAGVVACFLNQVAIAAICLATLVFLLYKFIAKEEIIIKEIKSQGGKNSKFMSYSGNKYSFKNPLTITIINQNN